MNTDTVGTPPGDLQALDDALVDNGLLLPIQTPGVRGRGPAFIDILERFDAFVMRCDAARDVQALSFPPVIARALLQRLGYLESFPHLIGSVHGFYGTEAEGREMAELAASGRAWEHLLDATQVMLTPAACYPVYPLFSGLLPDGGRTLTTRGWCFRHEPSGEPTRMQAFQMREFIRIGAPEQVVAWRDAWLERGMALLTQLGLPVESDIANDPFFGRGARLMSANQREQRLKFEISVPVISEQARTAVCSFNWHQDHFSGKFGIRQADGTPAHTACMGFGLERIVLALVKVHGPDPSLWRGGVREALWPDRPA